jgi:NTP pyrophosphatase (non-canonical NTP hydrolase)
MNYAEFVARNFIRRNTGQDGLMHAAAGIAGEAGELLDAVKKNWVYGKPLDFDNIIEELGDLEWYMQAMRSLLDIDRDTILQANIAKLGKRYPQGYTDAEAIERKDKA